ncbi:MAG: YigZ family protein [bacterium]|nr:YigZ family protein [bacterium]
MTDQSTFEPGLPDSVRVLAGPGQGELTEQRSRFLAFAFPAPDEAAAREAIAGVARRYHDARHACSAWRLGHGPHPLEHRNDDGEPSGTAGEPLLAAIRKRDLTDCVVVVVRYFGGVKLGTGGLARAYGAAAALALDAAPTADLPLGRRFRLRFPYPQRRVIEHLLHARGGRTDAEDYAVEVTWEVWLPHSGSRGFTAAVFEATAGAVTAEEIPQA